MPFNTTTVPPKTDAKVTVRFAGLMLLKPGADNTCEVGIHQYSSDHTFQVMLIVSKPKRPPTLIRLVTGDLKSPFSISVAPDPGSGFLAFTATADDLVRDAEITDELCELDYRWAVNLRSLHPNADINDGARPVVTLNAGVLYTPTLTRTDLSPELVLRTEKTPQHRVAADLAAAIDLPTGVVFLSWRELGVPQSLILPRPLDPAETTYTISLMNDPPIAGHTSHDELALYYRVLEVNGVEIPHEERWRLDVTFPQKTDEIPCLPIILNP